MIDLLTPYRVRGLRRNKKRHLFYLNEKPVCGQHFDIKRLDTPHKSDPFCGTCLNVIRARSNWMNLFKFIISGNNDPMWEKREYH